MLIIKENKMEIAVIKVENLIINNFNLIGWKGRAKINGELYEGEFGIKEDYYDENGNKFIVEWDDYIDFGIYQYQIDERRKK